MAHVARLSGQIRKIGEQLIPDEILEKIPNKIPIQREESPVYGKIVDSSKYTIYYIYAKKGDDLFCLVSTHGTNFRYETVSLKELENKSAKTGDMFIPTFYPPEEFATGENCYWNSNSYRKNIKIHTILNGILK